MMAAGGDLGAFWKVYKLHNRPHVRKLLEEYRVGTLSAADRTRVEAETEFASVYGTDPVRPQAAAGKMRVPSEHPWNMEPPVGALTDSFYTPNDLFFVRNHNNVPEVSEADWELEIEGNPALGIADRTFSLKELREKFPRTEVAAALQCAGNRQEDFVSEDRPLFVAPHWRNGAIGNARWAGVLVRDVLRECGMDVDAIALRKKDCNGMRIVNFIAEDQDETGVPYAGVIPIEKVVDPFGDALLAYEMNGETLPRDHGYPVRLLAPGHAGCRNVKWVRQIVVSAEASELDSGSRLDRHFAPDISWGDHRDHVDPEFHGHNRVRTDQGPVIQTLPVQSVISVPAHRARVKTAADATTVRVQGVAWSGAGRGITRVEVSADGGETFTAAELSQRPKEQEDAPPPESGMGRNWCWHHFAQDVPLPKAAREQLARGEAATVEVVSKAVDGDFNSQPERMGHTWNVLGICVNHWTRSRVTLDPNCDCTTNAAEPAPGSCKWPEDKFN
jgi:sulfite oxidase